MQSARRYAPLIKAAMELEKLPMNRARTQEVIRVISKRGYVPALHNFGRVRCNEMPPHAHGQGACVLVRGEYLVKHPNDLMGMLDLVNRVERKRRRQIELTGFSDAAWDEFRYLDLRQRRMLEWFIAEKKRTGQPPLGESDRKNLSDFFARWNNYAFEIKQYSVNKDSLLGRFTGPSAPDESSLATWRKEFTTWEERLRKIGFEKDATVRATAPDALHKEMEKKDQSDTLTKYFKPALVAASVLGSLYLLVQGVAIAQNRRSK